MEMGGTVDTVFMRQRCGTKYVKICCDEAHVVTVWEMRMEKRSSVTEIFICGGSRSFLQDLFCPFLGMTLQRYPKLFQDLFLGKYVTYMSGANKNAEKNLYDLLTVVVRGSDFESRMYGALTGQKVTQSKGDKITEITNNYFFKLEDGRYACDVTYVIDTTGKQGVVTTTNNVRIIVDDTKRGKGYGKKMVQMATKYAFSPILGKP